MSLDFGDWQLSDNNIFGWAIRHLPCGLEYNVFITDRCPYCEVLIPEYIILIQQLLPGYKNILHEL